MKEHVSFMKEPMDHFVAFMEASDRWCNNYDENLHLFVSVKLDVSISHTLHRL